MVAGAQGGGGPSANAKANAKAKAKAEAKAKAKAKAYGVTFQWTGLCGWVCWTRRKYVRVGS